MKPTILEIDNVRIKRWDKDNVFIEKEETYWNPIEKQNVTNYRFKGYHNTVAGALVAISRKHLLADENAMSDLSDTLKEIERSNQRILDAINAKGVYME